MIIRIVKMTFRPELAKEFINFFEDYKLQIRNFPGCSYLQVLQDLNCPNIIFSYSHWESESDLDNYRKSEVFKSVWPRTKALFLEVPLAWSTVVLHDLI
jgi:(4S)-4-hydroxy-5-phosphonooxypentane-2,3-dione isomerase